MPNLTGSLAAEDGDQLKDSIGNKSDVWLYDLATNCLGYGTLLVPGFIFIRYYQVNRERFELTPSAGLYKKFVTLFVFGYTSTDIGAKSSSTLLHRGRVIEKIRSSKYGVPCLFVFCFIGLLFSHLVWGFYQEKMMTRDYYPKQKDVDDSTPLAPERFRDSQFIVFLNRILAFVLSLSYLLITNFCQKSSSSFEHAAPFHKYSYASLSNILSSWCQYEALKYVTFPTQVVGKASKIIPTMIVGRFLHRKSYACHQYLTSGLISAGVSLFLLSGTESDTGKSKAPFSDSTTLSGVILIGGYLIFDSFTSNWQSNLFQEYGVGKMQMMCGVNFFSTLFTLIPLLERGNLFKSVKFMFRHPDFSFDCLTTSLCSASGQVFIFLTIAEFGPVALAVIMTIRQAFAILLSCLYYGHQISQLGILGLCVVFGALMGGQILNKICDGGGQHRSGRRRP